MANTPDKDAAGQEIDLEAVRKLVDALERDLPKVRGDSRDLQVLRDEVATLKNVLASPIRRHHWVREALHDLRMALDEGMDGAVAQGLKVGEYVSAIGRILGM
jgi:hypothetical protein